MAVVGRSTVSVERSAVRPIFVTFGMPYDRTDDYLYRVGSLALARQSKMAEKADPTSSSPPLSPLVDRRIRHEIPLSRKEGEEVLDQQTLEGTTSKASS